MPSHTSLIDFIEEPTQMSFNQYSEDCLHDIEVISDLLASLTHLETNDGTIIRSA